MVVKNIFKLYFTALAASLSITLGPSLVDVLRVGASRIIEMIF